MKAAEMNKVVEQYYTVAHVSLLVGVTAQYVVERINAGEFLDPHFSPGFEGEKDLSVVKIGTTWRIAGSAVNRWLQRRAFAGPDPMKAIKARTMGELRRKVRAARANEERDAEETESFCGSSTN
jgi:hypothetical protein